MQEKKKNDPIRVAIVDDDEEQRNSLNWLINSAEGFTCTGSYQNCADARKGIRENTPDVVLMDIGLGSSSGIQCVQTLKNEFTHLQIIMQTVYSEDEMIFESLRAGAVGYLLKKTPTDKILEAIRDAYEGGAPMSGEVARKVLSYFQAQKNTKLDTLLSERESEVLKALIKGHSYQAIAHLLFISVNTVRFHIKNIYEKLHVNTRSEAVAKVLKNKLM